SDQSAQCCSGRFKGQAVHAFQADKDHRELPLVFRAQLLVFCNFQTVKQAFVRADLKKALQHTHVQSLAKAPGAGEKVHFTPVPQKVCNKSCLVDIIEVIGPQFFKTINANGELLPHLVHAPFYLSEAAYIFKTTLPWSCRAVKTEQNSHSSFAQRPHNRPRNTLYTAVPALQVS